MLPPIAIAVLLLSAPTDEVVAKILESSARAPTAYARLETLTDRIGHRLSGSAALGRAVEWAATSLEKEGLLVERQSVMVPHWVRGEARARISAPIDRPLVLLALGGSGATPASGIKAELVVARSFEDLASIDPKGKIVLFDVPMVPTPTGPGYGEAVAYRGRGPALAAKAGAVATLVRSVTSRSLRSPHTGNTNFQDLAPIPAAAVSVEDASLLSRLARAGKVELELTITSKTLPDVESHNVIADLVGRERPDEVVVLGAHLDSWDVGQGAHDDGAGCAMIMDAIALLKREGLVPRRTVRVVLYTNEENGIRGARAYRATHGTTKKHVAAIESDLGSFAPIGFELEALDVRAFEYVARLAEQLGAVGATSVKVGWSGADVGELADTGALLLGYWMDDSTYFDYHHTDADTLDKVDPQVLQQNSAALAAMAYLLAETDRP